MEIRKPVARARFLGTTSDMQRQARESYRRFIRDPNHPSLRFKNVHPTEPGFVLVVRVRKKCGMQHGNS